MPYRADYDDTILIDDQDLQELDGVDLEEGALDATWAPCIPRVDPQNETQGGQDGQLIPGAAVPIDAFGMSIPVMVSPTDDVDTEPDLRARRAQTITNWRALIALCRGDRGNVTFTRRIPTGASTYIDESAPARFMGMDQIAWDNDFETIGFNLKFTNLKGLWLPEGSSTWVIP